MTPRKPELPPAPRFNDLRGLIGFIGKNLEMFPLLVDTVFRGIPAQLHRVDDEVTIITTNDGKDRTEAYRGILTEFVVNTWPARFGIQGTIMGWEGDGGLYSGRVVPPMADGIGWSRPPGSFSFHSTALLSIGGSPPPQTLMASERMLQSISPANGGHRVHHQFPAIATNPKDMVAFTLGHLKDGGWVSGVRYRPLRPSPSPPAFFYSPSFSSPRDSRSKHTFDISFSIPSPSSSFDIVETHFADDSETIPDYLIFESPLFPFGDLIDGSRQHFRYPREEVSRATIEPFPENSIAYLNLNHKDNSFSRVGEMLKVWWDDTTPFSFTDIEGRKISGVGMLHQRSVTRDPATIHMILNGDIRAVSAEPWFASTPIPDISWRLVRDMAFGGMALTNNPAIKTAVITKVCKEDGVCEPLSVR